MTTKVEINGTKTTHGFTRVYEKGEAIAGCKSDTEKAFSELQAYGFKLQEEVPIDIEIKDKTLILKIPSKNPEHPDAVRLKNHYIIILNKDIKNVIKPVDCKYESPHNIVVSKDGMMWTINIAERKELTYASLGKDLTKLYGEISVNTSTFENSPTAIPTLDEEQCTAVENEIKRKPSEADESSAHEWTIQKVIGVFQGKESEIKHEFNVQHNGKTYRVDAMITNGKFVYMIEVCNQGSYYKDFCAVKNYIDWKTNLTVWVVFIDKKVMDDALPLYECDSDMQKYMDNNQLFLMLSEDFCGAYDDLKNNSRKSKILGQRAVQFGKLNWKW